MSKFVERSYNDQISILYDNVVKITTTFKPSHLKGNPGLSTVRGFIWDQDGKVIVAFNRFSGHQSILLVKLTNSLHWFENDLSCEFFLVVESDSLTVVWWINS